jgi:hypothetical protein
VLDLGPYPGLVATGEGCLYLAVVLDLFSPSRARFCRKLT